MRHGNGPGIRSNRRECAGKELSAGLVSVVTNRTYTIWLTLAGGRSPVIYLFNLGASASSQAGGGGWARRAQAVNELERCAGSVKEDVTCWRSSTA